MEKEKVKQYLYHIGIAGIQSPSYEFLVQLHQAHMMNVPFENLSIMSKSHQSDFALSLDVKDIYAKVMDNNQGGYCYELNTIFGWLLEQLGFKVDYLVARVLLDESYKPDPGIMDHMTLLVTIDRPYLADVGFGNSFRSPLNFEAEHMDISGRYRLVQMKNRIADPSLNFEYEYFMEQKKNEEWHRLYMFSMKAFQPEDYKPSCKWMETSDMSSFTQRIVTTKTTHNGRISISSDNLTITNNREVTKKDINQKERAELLQTHFGITVEETLKSKF